MRRSAQAGEPRRMEYPPSEQDLFAFQVAWRLVVEGQTVQQLVDALSESRSTIYRALEHAEKRLGILDRSPRLTLPKGPGSEYLYDLVRVRPLEDRLRALLGPETGGADDYLVVRAVESEEGVGMDSEARRRTSMRMGMVAAEYVVSAMARGAVRTLGVSWGANCASFAHNMGEIGAHRLPYEAAAKIEVFSAHGLLGTREAEYVLSSANAQQIVMNLNAAFDRPPEATDPSRRRPVRPAQQVTQPLLVPERIASNARDLRTYYRFLAEDPSVQVVFGKQWALSRAGLARADAEPDTGLPLLGQPDIALVTGCGSLDRCGLYRAGLVTDEKLNELRAAGAVGDCSGHFVRAYSDVREHQALSQFSGRVIAPSPSELAATTRRCRDSGQGVGTILMAMWPRDEVAYALLRAGAVRSLICDDLLAESLIRRALTDGLRLEDGDIP